MEPLLDFEESKNGIIVKEALFLEWKSTEDFKVWTFKLRGGVKWSDGTPLESKHIIDSFERLLNPATGGFFSFLYYMINGAESYNKGNIKDFKKVGIIGDDKETIRFQLDRACAYFPKLLALMSAMPFRSDLFEKHGEKIFAAQHFVGLGPYLLKSWSHDREILLERNEKYYGEKPSIDKLRFKIINEDSTALRLFEARQIDALTSIPLPMVAKYKKGKNLRRSTKFQLSTWPLI
jgi:oligopeptide transport system substrate-binding protein